MSDAPPGAPGRGPRRDRAEAGGDAGDPPRPPSSAATRAVHAGERPPVPRHPAVTPVFLTAPFSFDDAGELEAAFTAAEAPAPPGPGAGEPRAGLYSRYSNPSVRVVEAKLAALEGAADAVAFASGMGAISAVLLTLLASGSRLLAAAELYGGTDGFFSWLDERHPEIEVERAALAGIAARLGDDARPAPDLVWVETPTNPLLECVDLERVAAAAHARGARVAVDNTFATPVLQRPLELGCDLVVHSATKFLGGHSDVVAGVVAGDAGTMEAVRRTRTVTGAVLDPHAAFLVARGMRTLALRVERQSETAGRLARFLAGHPAVARVFYPGLEAGPEAPRRSRMRGGGAMLAFELRGGGAAARSLLDRLETIRILPSLGGVETSVVLPAATSHRNLAPAVREAAGIAEGLVRMSCGIEAVEDLEADLARALGAAGSAGGDDGGRRPAGTGGAERAGGAP